MKRAAIAFCWLALAATLFLPLASRKRFSRISCDRLSAEEGLAVQSRPSRAKFLRAAKTFSLPMMFEPNVGQAPAPAQFVGRGQGMTVLLADDGIAISVPAKVRAKTGSQSSTLKPLSAGAPADAPDGVVWLHIVDSKSHNKPQRSVKLAWRGHHRLHGETNYFIGSDASRWRTHVPLFSRVEAANVIPGVGATLYGNDMSVEYDLRLAPGTAPDRVRLKIIGAAGIRLNTRGDLLMSVGGRELRMATPNVYELTEIPAERRASQSVHGRPAPVRPSKNSATFVKKRVEGGYAIEADGTIGFRVDAHDPRAALVLDPSLTLTYSTFLGGEGDDEANSLALDANGRIYLGGTTSSAGTWPEAGATVFGPGGNADFFVAKIDPAASGANSLLYLTFIGGSGTETGGLIALDQSGDVALTGTTTSGDYPVTDASKRTAGANDVAVTEIDPTGAKVLFSTLFGGNGAEATQNAGAVAVNSGGDIYIASDTTSTNLCNTPGAFRTTTGGGASDGFLAILRPKQAPPERYCTYLGITAQVGVSGLALDSAGNAYLAGFTSDPGASFPAKNAFQSAYAGGDFDGFVMKIIPAGKGASDLSYATLLGGENSDQALAIAAGTDLPATAYVTGMTQSTTFPASGANAAFEVSLKGTTNAFLSVIMQNPTTGAASLKYSTYLGGSRADTGQSVTVPQANEVYVAGNATSPDFPWLDNFQPLSGDQDAFVAKMDPTSSGSASLVYATPLGGTTPAGAASATSGNAVAADGGSHVYVAGLTTAADFPQASHTASGAQPTCASCQASPAAADAFVAAIDEGANAEPSVSFGVTEVNFGASAVGSANIPPVNVGVINTGSAPLNISAIQLAGTNSADFSLQNFSGCEAAPVAPAGVCSFSVGFVPSQVGTEGATISITDDAPGSPHALQAAGIGSGPLGVLTPASVSFGNQPVGAQSRALMVTLTNTGNETLQAANVALAGPDAAQFQLQDTSCTSAVQISPGGSCEFNVLFQPAITGPLQAEAVVEDNSGGIVGTQQQVPMAGTGVPAAPEASIEPSLLTFAPQPVGSVSGVQTVTLQNTGSISLNVAAIDIAGADGSSFRIVASGNSACPLANGTLAAGGLCSVGVNFAPQAAGAKSAILQFNDNASGNPQSIPLSGSGVVPGIQLSPTSVNFGTQSVATTSPGVNVTVANAGTGPLTISTIGVTGANAADFGETNNCGSSLGPGANCTIAAKFTPTAAGNRAAAITVADSAQGSPQSVPLAGTAIAPAVALAPTSINFGSQLNGTPSTAAPVAVTNGGTGTLVVSKASFSGTNASDFSETDNCRVQLTAGGTCKIQVIFKPTAAGMRSAALLLADNAPGSPQSLPLNGIATDFSFDAPGAGATSATVTAGQTAKYKLDLNSTDGFTGTVALTCSGAVPEGSCKLAQQSLDVTANGQSSFQVNVTTTGASNGAAHATPWTWPGGARLLLGATTMAVVLMVLLAVWFASTNAMKPTARITTFAAACVIVVFIAIAAGCGSGGGDPPSASQGTPPGTYSLTVTGTADGGNRAIQLSLIVQ